MAELPLSQIAMSVADVQRSQRWYRDVFGYQESGGTYMFVPVLGSADIQGVPGATSICWWLLDRQDFFQLELFQFTKPEARPLPVDWRPCDIGYTTIGIHVDDFDATLQRLLRRGGTTLSDPVGGEGMRRVCVRDPDGVLLEVMEDDPRAAERRNRPYEAAAVTRFVTLSVPDLDAARRTWVDVLGLPVESDVRLHTPEHEQLWGLAGATRETLLLRAQDIFVEVVHYTDPVGRPWPDGYRISDHGLLNVAFGFRSLANQQEMVRRCTEAGITPNTTKSTLLKHLWTATYVNDPLGFSIELLYHRAPGKRLPVNPFDLLELGFAPSRAPVRRAVASALSAATPAQVWRILVDHEHMADWSPFARSQVVHRPADGGEVGTVRRLDGGPMGLSLTETVVVAEAPHRLEYAATGVPGGRFLHGFVTLDETAGGGTRIAWEAQLRSPLPVTERIATYAVRSLANGLGVAADRTAYAH